MWRTLQLTLPERALSFPNWKSHTLGTGVEFLILCWGNQSQGYGPLRDDGGQSFKTQHKPKDRNPIHLSEQKRRGTRVVTLCVREWGGLWKVGHTIMASAQHFHLVVHTPKVIQWPTRGGLDTEFPSPRIPAHDRQGLALSSYYAMQLVYGCILVIRSKPIHIHTHSLTYIYMHTHIH